MDPVINPSEEGLSKIIEGLKRTYGLEVDIKVEISSDLFLVGSTVHSKRGYQIRLSEPEPYVLLHEFYHIVFEERVMKHHVGSPCEFCAKIVQEMQNVIVDLAIERAIHNIYPQLFVSYFPRIKDNLDLMGRCGVIYFDPTRTVAYNLYLETAIKELYPTLREDYEFWDVVDLPGYLTLGIENALCITSKFIREGRPTWRDITNFTVDLSWAVFEADVMFIEDIRNYWILCITNHNRASSAVSDMITSLKKRSSDCRKVDGT